MNASLVAVLNDGERLLIAQTERAELAALDEDAAIDLETRVRRARSNRALRSPASMTRRASIRAAGARRQAKHDSR